VVTIPLKENWNSWALFSFVFAGLIQLPLSESAKKLKNSRYWILSIVFLAWMALTWFWDSYNDSFIKTIETYGSFLAFPIVFTIIPKLSFRDILIVCHAFVAAIVIACIVSLVKAYFEYQVTHDQFVFSYHYLSNQVGLSAIYLSNYCVAALSWLLYFHFIDRRKDLLFIPRIIVVVACLFLFVMVFLLSSKMIIAIMLLMLLFLILYSTRFKKLYITIPIIMAICLSAVFMARNLTYLKFRLDVTELKMYAGSQDDQNGVAARLIMWQSAAELIKEQPIQGYGIIGSREMLKKKYAEKNFMLGVTNEYNAHNQYLQIILNCGVIGLLLFLWLLFMPLAAAFREKKILLIMQLGHYLLASIVESTLTVQKEQIFYWFFIWLFYWGLSSLSKASITTDVAPKEA
jgi:O-antigen ligase